MIPSQNFNRHYAEYSGYWLNTSFLDEIKGKKEESFYDSNTGKLLFVAPKERTWDDWIKESKSHGWPSFRDTEVNWEYVRVLPNGETVSVDGTHLVSSFLFDTGNVCFAGMLKRSFVFTARLGTQPSRSPR